MTTNEFLAIVKNHLRNHKGEWFNAAHTVDGHYVQLKFYGMSIQAMRVDGLEFGGLYDIPTQRAFLATIRQNVEEVAQ